MKGSVISYDEATHSGKISGHDGQRYAFTRQNWANDKNPKVGMNVDFDVSGTDATDVILLAGTGSGGDKTKVAALLLVLFFGAFGFHRFYVGKVGTGIVMLLLGITMVGLIVTGIWALVDLITIATGSFKDAEGNDLV